MGLFSLGKHAALYPTYCFISNHSRDGWRNLYAFLPQQRSFSRCRELPNEQTPAAFRTSVFSLIRRTRYSVYNPETVERRGGEGYSPNRVSSSKQRERKGITQYDLNSRNPQNDQPGPVLIVNALSQPRRSYQGKAQLIKSRVNVRFTLYNTRHLMIKEDWWKMKLNKLKKAECTKAELLAVCEACKAVFCPMPGLRRKNL